MIVYREQRRRVATVEVLRRIIAARGFEREMELGELHAGIADAYCPDCDREVDGMGLPAEIEISVPEGFAYYAVDPELYRIAARRFRDEVRPQQVAVIGIRSIGTTLGVIVANELGGRLWTVRPRGHPWDRRVHVGYDIARAWLAWPGHFAIVDEGPGLSGSSFASVADFLSGLGIADHRIVFLPSWAADGSSFVSETARRRWKRHRKYTAEFEELGLFDDAAELSAGRWRKLRHVRSAVQPQHERRKYLRGDRLYKFAGYGRYGRDKLARAERLGGWIPDVLELERGFIATRWVEGRSVRMCNAFIEHAARYLAHISREFSTHDAADVEGLAKMIEVNTGRAWPGDLPESRAVALDGRMLPHDWLDTPAGYVKTDALDHYDDHFFPGPQDIAWDLAAFGVECRGGGAYLVERYQQETRDPDLYARLPFYRMAYLAFRRGYCDLASQALGETLDAARFRLARSRYDELIRTEPWMTKTSRSFV